MTAPERSHPYLRGSTAPIGLHADVASEGALSSEPYVSTVIVERPFD